MHINFFHFFFGSQIQKRKQMVDVAVHPAVGKQSEQMEAALVLFHVFNRLKERFVFKEAAVFNCLGHPGQILIHNPSGTDIQMPHFGVSHLSVRKTDGFPACLERCMRIFVPIAVKVRFVGLLDGISFPFFTEGKTIQNTQQHWFRSVHCFSPSLA